MRVSRCWMLQSICDGASTRRAASAWRVASRDETTDCGALRATSSLAHGQKEQQVSCPSRSVLFGQLWRLLQSASRRRPRKRSSAMGANEGKTIRIHPPNPVRSADDVKNPGRKCYRLAIIAVIRLKNGESLNRKQSRDGDWNCGRRRMAHPLLPILMIFNGGSNA